MAIVRGNQGALYFDKEGSGTLTEIETVRSWTLNVEKEVLDATAQGDTFRSFVGSLVTGTGTAEVLYDKPANGGAANDFIVSSVTETDNAVAKFELYMDENATKKITFDGLITGADYSATVGEVEVITINFSASGTITVSNL